MRKRNTSGPARGKSDRSSGKKSFDKPTGSRFPKGSKRDSSDDEKRPFRKKSSGTAFEKGGERRGKSFDKPSGVRFSREGRDNASDDEKRPFRRKSSETSFGKSGDRRGKSDDYPKKSGFEKSERRPASDSRSFKKKSTSSEGGERKKKFSKSGSSSFSSQPVRARKKDQEGEQPRGFFNKQKFNRNRPGKYTSKKEEAPTIANTTGKIRLNRYIANSGICSRREADERIKLGLVSVNGKVITEMGFLVSPGDDVRYESKKLQAEKPVYILMNKPKGYLTTTSDPQERNTVMHIIGNAVRERIYPVGRLDRNTTGLLLFTNDGDLAEKLSHPSYNVKKIYKVELNRPLTKNDFQKIVEGVQLEEGRAMIDDLAIVSDDGKTVGIELHIGWNRVVRRIFEKLEYEVLKLDRSVYAGLDKKDLPRGHFRHLTKEEIVRLKHFK